MTDRVGGADAYATRSQVKRMVSAAQDAGICVGGVECTRDGTIRVLAEAIASLSASTEYDSWKQGKGHL